MRRLLLLAATMGMVLLVASPAFSQGVTPPGPLDGVCEGEGEGDPDCARGLLEGLEAQAPGEQYADEIAAVSLPEAPLTASPPPSTPEASATMTALPDTGGGSLIALGAGVVFLGGGLLVMRRR